MVCFPSLFEGFGIPVVEAMAMGCPVACSNVASLPEIVGDAALLFSPENPEIIAKSILRLWNDERLRKELIEKGKKRARLFSIENFASSHIKAFEAAKKSFRKYRYWYFKFWCEPSHQKKMMSKKNFMTGENSDLKTVAVEKKGVVAISDLLDPDIGPCDDSTTPIFYRRP